MLKKIKIYSSSGCRVGLKHLQNLTQKSNVLHINGEGYAKENKDLYEFGFVGVAFTVTSKYHTKDTQGHCKVQ